MGDEGAGAVEFLTGFSVGSRIAGYRLEEQIGQGGMAVVFRAQDERLHRQVALKVLSPALVADEEFRHRFIRESRSAAAVDEPHIVPVFEAGDADGVLFIAMRYVPDGDAGTLVRRVGPLPIGRAAEIISATASALDAAHAAGLVHRDVKPANMLVDVHPGRPDHVYLSDFGLTKGSWSSTSLTSTGHFMGTLDYAAPEQIRGQQVDARTDEYALACVAFTLLSGEPPFHRDEAMAVLYAHLSEPPPMLASRRPGLPPEVDEVMQQALAKAAQDRFPSCGRFADALRIALGRYDSDPMRPAPVIEKAVFAGGGGRGSGDNDKAGTGGTPGPAGGDRSPGPPGEGPDSGGGGTGPRPRFLKGRCPQTIAVGKPFSLLASIVLTPGPASAMTKPFDVPPGGLGVLLVAYAPELRLLSDQQQRVHVPAEADSEPVMFELCADSPVCGWCLLRPSRLATASVSWSSRSQRNVTLP